MDHKSKLRCKGTRHKLLSIREWTSQGIYDTLSLPIIIQLRVTDSLFVQCDIQLNRKVLSELAIHEPRSFQVLYIVYIPFTTVYTSTSWYVALHTTEQETQNLCN